MDRLLLLCLIYALILTHSCISAYTAVELTLKEYVVDGNHYDGTQCDEIFGVLGQCDPEFIFCFDILNGTNDMDTCSFHRIQTQQWDNTNTVTFGAEFTGTSYNWDNPLEYYEMNNPFFVNGFFNSFNGFRVKVTVYDNDVDDDDLIDLIYFDYTDLPARNISTAVREQHTLYGSRLESPSSLTLELMVYCGSESYTSDCSVYCYANPRANYVCDPDTGGKICNAGFESPEEDCSIKTDNCESHSCVNGGTCLDGYNSYTCACLRNYTGPFCQYHKCELETDFCKNGGSCYTDDFGDVKCSCRDGFQGLNCGESTVSGGSQENQENQESNERDGTQNQDVSDEGSFPTWAIVIIVVVIAVLIVAVLTVVIVRNKRKENAPASNVNGLSSHTLTPDVLYANGAVSDVPPAYTEITQPEPTKQTPPPDNMNI